MLERLAIPAWDAPPRTLLDWRVRLDALGHPPDVERAPGETWLVLEPLGLRALAVLEDGALSALHVEIVADDPAPALALLERAARALDWEVHDEDDEDDDVDEGS